MKICLTRTGHNMPLSPYVCGVDQPLALLSALDSDLYTVFIIEKLRTPEISTIIYMSTSS